MDEDGDDSKERKLSRRDKAALKAAYLESRNKADKERDESRIENVGSGLVSNINLSSDTSMLTVSSTSSECKRPRVETRPEQLIGGPSSASQSFALPTTSRARRMLQAESPHSNPQLAVSKQTVGEEEILKSPRTDLWSTSSTSTSARPLHELHSSSVVSFDEPTANDSDDEYFDAVDHFGAEYFLNYDDDEESSSSVPRMCLLNLSGSVESLFLEDDSNKDGISSRGSREEDREDKPLYKEAPISQWESLTSILTFVQSEHLSGAGLGRLLSLINLHLPKPNNFLKTPNRLFDVLDGLSDPVHIHYYCSSCFKFRKGPTDDCDCETSDEDKCILFFITLPLEAQLKKMFQRPGFLEDLKYRDNRTKKDVNNIEDIYDSEVYKEAQTRFVQFCINLTLMWNTDGLQIFKSNSFSLWPFYFIINELSPLKRYLSENLLIGGLWGSVGKPHPNVYLVPIYRDLKALQHGFDVQCYGEENPRKVLVQVICGCCDAPARASFMNMKQHSGFYSCPFCLTKGEKPGDATVFPYEEEQILRTVPQYEEHVKWAVQNKVVLAKTVRNEENCCGVKGPTVLKDIVPNIFSSMAIDSMHCLYLGVMRQLLHLWSDKEHKDQPWSIFSKLSIVNARMRKLTPPHWLQRTPQTLDKLIYWKATELRFFLFHLSLIVLDGILLPDYYNHFAQFVKVASLLNSSSISDEDLLFSSLLSNQFLSQFAGLYGVENMSHNLHMILHLEKCVRSLGPLWSNSCFKFEDINGRLSNFIHGTNHVGLQIQSNLSIITQLPLMINDLKDNDVKDYCLNIHRRYRLNLKEKISPHVYCVGTFKNVPEEYAWAETLLTTQVESLSTSNVQIFSRLLKDGILYVADSYGRGLRVSSYVKFLKDGNFLCGHLQCFLKMNSDCFAVIKPLHVSAVEIQGIVFPYLFRHENRDDVMEGFSDSSIVKVCDLMSVMSKVTCDDRGFTLCEPLNDFEYE